jgi:large subunit ribosomal protein L30
MRRLRLKQIKSAIDRPKRQKDTLYALGLRRMNSTVEHNATPQIVGMALKVKHLIHIEEI